VSCLLTPVPKSRKTKDIRDGKDCKDNKETGYRGWDLEVLWVFAGLWVLCSFALFYGASPYGCSSLVAMPRAFSASPNRKVISLSRPARQAVPTLPRAL
jgi:hypothetical protein